jgi:nitroimidazol reductase NimA-like FMN-containing flavoprotein (pyridoxamine 5'-phosphate oxidase superfamily)
MTLEIDPKTRLEVLARPECLRLLQGHTLGRLAVVDEDARPYVFPVNYAVVDGSVVFRTGDGTKLHRAPGHWVAFEVDGVDAVYHTGWSVLVSGVAEAVTIAAELARLETVPLGVWSPSPKPTWLRVRTMFMSGRRIPPPGSTDAGC